MTALSIGLGTANAFLLERARFPGKRALSVLMLVPLVIPGVILGVSILAFASRLAELAANWDCWAGTPEAAARFGALQKISIDYGVMEKARQVLLVEMDCDWQDLGSWLAVAGTRRADEHGNVALAERSLIVDGQNNVLVTESGHLIVALGVSDLVVVHSDDATLVCRRDQVERIKDLARLREAAFGERFE